MFVLGLMSGTSADGVDAALVEFKGSLSQPKWKLISKSSIEYPDDLKQLILEVSQGTKISSNEWLELENKITQFNAQAALICDPNGLSQLIGCHGQTVWHKPPTKESIGASLQIIRAPLLAQLLGKPVIYDFRGADLVLGGQGAPLVPLADEALIGRVNGWRAILNLGGIANLSLIPPLNGPDCSSNTLGWDCGPANSLIDLAVQQITEGRFFYDKDGLIAKNGKSDELIIAKWLNHPFLNLKPPKSTGREEFGLDDLSLRMQDMLHLSNENKIATLTSFTAALVAQDLKNLYKRYNISPIDLLVAGGGANNPILIQQLIERCKGIKVSTIDAYGIPNSSREALAFALLAWWNINRHDGNSPFITGASQSAILGIKVEPTLKNNGLF